MYHYYTNYSTENSHNFSCSVSVKVNMVKFVLKGTSTNLDILPYFVVFEL